MVQCLKFAPYFETASMFVFHKKTQLQEHLKPFREKGLSIGFVPTMGALHAGHLSLLEKSRTENAFTVISIFVNPTQFNNPDDLLKYPRTLEDDVAKIEELDPHIIVYAPSVSDIYGAHTVSEHFDYDGLENQMEGKHRPGHFDGVGTVVSKLFEIIRPDVAYFGEKDFQQLQIVRKMTQKLGLPVQIKGLPIYRESNGLAMSSRNARLSAAEREKAAVIYKTLKTAQGLFGTKSAEQITNAVLQIFEQEKGIELEYFEIADEATLQPFEEKIPGRHYRAFIAVFVGDVRLIDTIPLN